MTTSLPSRTHPRAFAFRDWFLLTLLLAATTYPAGVLSWLMVKSQSGQADGVLGVLGTDVGMTLLFFFIPAFIGFTVAWTAWKRAWHPVAACALGAVTPPLLLALLSTIATVGGSM